MKTKNLISLLCLGLSSCSSVFYQPDSRVYSSPSSTDLEIEIKTEDGYQLSARHLTSGLTPSRGSVVHFHGNAQNLSSHIKYFNWLPEQGYDLLIFDYRGYGKSAGIPDKEGVIKDGQAVLNYAFNKLPKPLFVVGQSLGGAIAVPSIVLSPKVSVAGLILESTFHSYRKMAQSKLSDFFLTYLFQYPLSFLVGDNLSPIDYIKQIHAPIVFVHSDQDPVVPWEEAKPLFESANEPKHFWMDKGGGHTTAFIPGGPFRNELLSFLSSRPRSGAGGLVDVSLCDVKSKEFANCARGESRL